MEKVQHLEKDEPPPYNVATAYDSATAPEEGGLLDQTSCLRSVQPPPLDLPPPEQAPFTETPKISRNPTLTLCPQCRMQITTNIDYVIGGKTHIFAFLLAACGCFCCCCLPYCMDVCKSAHHYCPRCGKFLYSYDGFK